MLKKASFLLLVCFVAAGAAMAQVRDKESNLKAVFIYNFTKFIEWDNIMTGNNFIIGMMGSSALDEPINAIAKSNIAKDKKIVLRHFSKPEDIGYCQILFIPRGYPVAVKTVLEKVDKGVLVISEEAGAAKQGACINFVLVHDKLKFEINQNAIYSAGLKASSQLLKLAIIVD